MIRKHVFLTRIIPELIAAPGHYERTSTRSFFDYHSVIQESEIRSQPFMALCATLKGMKIIPFGFYFRSRIQDIFRNYHQRFLTF